MANGRDWTESSEIPLSGGKEPWTRHIKMVWWAVIIATGAWAFFRVSPRHEGDVTKPDAAVVRDAGGGA